MRMICAVGLLVSFWAPASGRTSELTDESLASKVPIYDLKIRLQPAKMSPPDVEIAFLYLFERPKGKRNALALTTASKAHAWGAAAAAEPSP
jgi:hypothetical protein